MFFYFPLLAKDLAAWYEKEVVIMSKNIIVFDIGGTWFRSGICLGKNKIQDVLKRPSINYKSFPQKTVRQLQEDLILYISEQVIRLRKKNSDKKLTNIAISMGGALNAHTGFILNSGPLWGPKSLPFDLVARLKDCLPQYKISIINDVSAALLREVGEINVKKYKKTMLITIGTGIACRVYDSKRGTIPVDRTHGLQGEIGHLPIKFTFNSKPVNFECDCGGKNHLNAFCSGRGINKIFQKFSGENYNFDNFILGVKTNDKIAKDILRSVTKPIAELLLTVFTVDPEIERVVLTGGVVHSLGKFYKDSLIEALEKQGMYQITYREPDFFKKRICLGKKDDLSGLLGAALSLS